MANVNGTCVLVKGSPVGNRTSCTTDTRGCMTECDGVHPTCTTPPTCTQSSSSCSVSHATDTPTIGGEVILVGENLGLKSSDVESIILGGVECVKVNMMVPGRVLNCSIGAGV